MSATRDVDLEQVRRIHGLSSALEKALPTGVLRSPTIVADLAARWCERHRHWHGPVHVLGMIQEIDATMPAGEERDVLKLAAIYHDIIYDPRAADNEEASARLLESHAQNPGSKVVRQALELIRASTWSGPVEGDLLRRFFALDTWQLSDECPLDQRLAYERAIRRQYEWVDWSTYQTKRREFLEAWARRFPKHQRGARECMELLDGLQPRIAAHPKVPD